MQVRYIDEAIDDVHEILDFLRDRSPSTANRFAHELEALAAKLLMYPEFGYRAGKSHRKAALGRLPWSVVYRVDAARAMIWIVVVRHRLLRPSFGMDRQIPGE